MKTTDIYPKDKSISNIKFDLKDVTFLLLVRIDTVERIENILAVTEFLASNFNTNIEVLEIASYNNGILEKLLSNDICYAFLEDNDPVLYRTKYLNYMMKSSRTPFVAVWDVDVLAPVKQILDAVDLLRQGSAEFVYPYAKKFLDTYSVIRKIYMQNRQIEFLERNTDKMNELYPPDPVGGAFFCNLDAYRDIGLENESFYGWGIEDGERYHRWEKSRYKIKRIQGFLYHLSHPRGLNSVFHHWDQSFIKLRILDSSVKKNINVNR